MTAPRPGPANDPLETLLAAAVQQLDAHWQHLAAAQQAVLSALQSAQRRGARRRSLPPALRQELAAFTAATARFHTDAGALIERWTAVDLPRAYRLGAEDALHTAVPAPGTPPADFHWTPAHQRALASVTGASYPALTGRLNDTVRRAQAFARAVTAAARASEPPTAADLAARHRLDTVTYRHGARLPAQAWARSALAAQAVTATNTGALTAAGADLTAFWVQVTDGPDCGWSSHTDPDRAHGTLRSAALAARHLIAHPGCRRRFTPRPDLTHDAVTEGQPA
ncbi:hypothetical protein [Streptomyces sp. CC224B]|uniref:hypothetical protein n=1 Tax=Streptomyces sp. CC224B TaxID=3044571 RepID=UPI0024A83EFE|nr:hypothetical protein [Streptomyces sp. CC224B]